MNEENNPTRSLMDRLGGNAEERLGRALSELLESPFFTGAIGRAFDAREKAAQAQEVALGALNLPSAADIERLTRRVRSLSHRLEAIEDGVERLDTSRLAERRPPSELDARMGAVERQLDVLGSKLDVLLSTLSSPARTAARDDSSAAAKPSGPKTSAQGAGPKAKAKAGGSKAAGKQAVGSRPARAKRAAAPKP